MAKLTGSEDTLADRLASLAEWARALGRTAQADRFLLLAWTAFEGGELPAWRCAGQGAQDLPSQG